MSVFLLPQSLDRSERLQVTKLLGSMFSAEGSSLAQHNPALWKAYLGRSAAVKNQMHTLIPTYVQTMH